MGLGVYIMNSSIEKIYEKFIRMVFKICKGMYVYIYVKYNLIKYYY